MYEKVQLLVGSLAGSMLSAALVTKLKLSDKFKLFLSFMLASAAVSVYIYKVPLSTFLSTAFITSSILLLLDAYVKKEDFLTTLFGFGEAQVNGKIYFLGINAASLALLVAPLFVYALTR